MLTSHSWRSRGTFMSSYRAFCEGHEPEDTEVSILFKKILFGAQGFSRACTRYFAGAVCYVEVFEFQAQQKSDFALSDVKTLRCLLLTTSDWLFVLRDRKASTRQFRLGTS